jgi:uncharacterized protein (DUF58 family)
VKRVAPALWPSARGISALLGVCALLALSAAYPGLALAAAIAGAVVLALFAADLASGPALGAFTVERLPQEFVALLRPGVVRYSVVNRSATAVRAGIVETPVASLEFGDEPCARVAARSTREVERPFVPRERGLARFGTIYCWVENGVGFLRRRVACEAPAEVRVFPDLLGVERVGTLAQRRTRLDAGIRRLRVRGAGTEFESLRDYAPDDAFTSIDWKATAHRGRLTVAQYEIERSQQVIVVLDAGRLMCAPVGDQRKFDYALTAALSVARIATLAGDAVGLIAVAARPLVDIAPRRGAAHHAALVRAAYGLQPALEEPDYETIVAGIKSRYSKRSLVIVFTDLFDPVASAAVLASLTHLVPRHLVVCALMSDALIGGALEREPLTAHDAYRASVALTLSDERREAIAVLRSRGIIVVDAPAPALSVGLIDAYLDLKARGRL